MSDDRIERLITDGFLFTSNSIRGSKLRATYGDGYAEGAVIGSPEGLRTWKVKIAVLPDIEGEYLIESEFGLQTRATYLWGVYERNNVANAFKPLWLRDPRTKHDFLVEIVEDELDYEMLCLTANSTGLTLRQRRVYGVQSPTDPILIENNATM